MTNNLLKVTVVTATFNIIENNREKFFRQCVESIHNQTYKNIEHIIIDGASSDGTLDILKEYEKKGWIKYYSEPDKGMCDAMNKGIKKATGEYIAILNSDDYYELDAIESLVDGIQKNDADFSYGETNMLSREDAKLLFTFRLDNFSIPKFFCYIPFNHEAMLCKKTVYEKIGYYDWEKYWIIADYDFISKLILNDYKGAPLISKIVLNFRMDGTTNLTDYNNLSSTFVRHIKNLHNFYLDFWSKFLNTIEVKKIKKILEEKRHYLSVPDVEYIIRKPFLNKYKKFLVGLKLKNFSYENLDKYINECYKNPANTCNKRIYILKIPVLKIQTKADKIRYRLFNFIPLLKVKKRQNKCEYKLFDFLPIFTIKIK